MEISLVIPAYNEAAYIGETLRTALACGTGKFREIIVVDNASTDDTAKIATAFGVRVVHAAQKGLTHARQAGYEASTGEWIAFIDADTLITPAWLDVAERALRARPDAVSLSGPRRYFGTAWYRRWILNAMWGAAPVTYRFVGCMILGGNFIVRREAIAQIGGFDTSIEFYGEDTDLARRLATVGKTLFRMDFWVTASARRFEAEGIFMPNIVYALNYAWPILFHRPYHREYTDIR
jgi:glycosyltransferase involved in cell wall biosynthesis